MMKSFGSLLMGVLCASLLASEVNLVRNPGFEEGEIKTTGDVPVPGWRARSAAGTLPFHAIVTDEPHSGSRCARIQIPEEVAGAAYFSPLEKLVLQGGKTYRFSFWARPLEGKGRLRLVRENKDGSHRLVREHMIESDPNVKTWRRVTLDVTLPDPGTEAKYHVFLNLTGPGLIYFDDFSITEIVPDRYHIDFYPGSVSHQKKFPVLKGETASLILYAFTDEKPAGHELELELPAGLTLLDALPLYCGKEPAPDFSCTSEKGRTVCKIPLAPGAVLPQKRYTTSKRAGTGMLFSVAKDMEAGPLAWKLRKDGVLSAEGVMDIVPVDPFAGKLPVHLPFYSWNLPLLSHLRNRENIKTLLAQIMKSGFRGGGLAARPDAQEIFDEAGFMDFESMWFQHEKNHCMTRLLQGDQLERRFKGRLAPLKAYKNTMLNLDYETSMAEYNHWCDDCRAAFEAATGKSAADLPDAAAVQKAYPEEYLKFRSGQHYRLAGIFAKACHEAGAKAGFCSYARSASPESNLRIEKMVGDQKAYYALMDAVTAMIYHTPDKLWDPVKTNLEYWPDIIVTFTSDEFIGGNTPGYALLTPESVYLETMIAAMLNLRGVLLFVGGHTFDALQINALRMALDEVASFEEFLYSGETPDENTLKVLRSSPSVRSRLYSKDGRLLLGIINPDTDREGMIEFAAAPSFGSFALLDRKAGKYYRNRDSSCVFGSGTTLSLGLKPGQVLFLELEKETPEHRQAEGIDMPEPAGMKPTVVFEDAVWKCIRDRDGLRIAGPLSDYRILPSDGAVLAGPGILADGDGSGGFFRDLILFPKVARWCPDSRAEYELDGITADEKTLTLRFSHPFKLSALRGLVLGKTFRLKTDPVSVEAEIRLVNRSGEPMTIAYWSHNRTDLEVGKAVYTVGADQVVKAADRQRQEIKLPAAAPCRIAEQSAGLLECTAGEVENYYLWIGTHGATMEFQGKRQTIPPEGEARFRFTFTPRRENK